jgi:hypothetical protein
MERDDEKGDVNNYWMTLGIDTVLETERGRTLKNSLWKRLCDYYYYYY